MHAFRILASPEDCCLGLGCWWVIGARDPAILCPFFATSFSACMLWAWTLFVLGGDHSE